MKIISLFLGIVLLFLTACGSSPYDTFAQCLTDKNSTVYGAFWCPHCARQKELFGNSFEKVNYVECSLPDKSGQTEACISANITSYPTWEFSNGERVQGVQTLQQLAQKSSCTLPWACWASSRKLPQFSPCWATLHFSFSLYFCSRTSAKYFFLFSKKTRCFWVLLSYYSRPFSVFTILKLLDTSPAGFAGSSASFCTHKHFFLALHSCAKTNVFLRIHFPLLFSDSLSHSIILLYNSFLKQAPAQQQGCRVPHPISSSLAISLFRWCRSRHLSFFCSLLLLHAKRLKN